MTPMGLKGGRFNVRLQVLLSCLHTFRTVLVRRINKVIKNQDNFPCGDNIPRLFDQVPNVLVTFNEKSAIDLCQGFWLRMFHSTLR